LQDNIDERRRMTARRSKEDNSHMMLPDLHCPEPVVPELVDGSKGRSGRWGVRELFQTEEQKRKREKSKKGNQKYIGRTL
jgi:hypothetical protein